MVWRGIQALNLLPTNCFRARAMVLLVIIWPLRRIVACLTSRVCTRPMSECLSDVPTVP